MNKDEIRPLGTKTIDRFLTAMSGGVIHDPENAVSGLVGLLAHDLADKTIYGSNPALGFTAAKNFSAVDVPSCKVRPGALTKVLVLDTHGAIGSQGQRRLFATASLNAGFFVCRNDKFINFQGDSFPDSLIEVEDATGLCSKVWIARENPTAMLPRAKGIAGEPAPQRSTADLGCQTLNNHLLPDLRDRESGQGKPEAMRKFASECLNLNDETGGKSEPFARRAAAPQGQGVEKARISCATY